MTLATARMIALMYIGVDLGTTSTKVAAFGASGELLALASHGYPLEVPEPGAAEQDPGMIVQATLKGLGEVVAKVGAQRVRALCFGAAMHSIVPLDASGVPLTRALTWADGRASRWAERIRRIEGGARVAARTGTPPYAMSPLAKLRWLREEYPEVTAQAARFISIKEYVLHALFGIWAVDHSTASASGLFGLLARDWDDEALNLARVKREQLSPLVPTTWRLPPLRPEIARELGLDPQTPAIIGANDGALSNLGSGAVTPGIAAISLGTSGAMRVTVDSPYVEPGGRTFCYALTEDRWVVGGPTNNGAIVLRWLRDNFAPTDAAYARAKGEDPYQALLSLAARAPAGSDGLLFLPYLLGERAPLWSSGARGAYIGVSIEHRREHFLRAALEGVALNLALVSGLLAGRVPTPRELRASGGFARSPLWRQILCDVLDRPLGIPQTVETAALGATLLARVALGELPGLEAAGALVSVQDQHSPDPAASAVYADLLPIFARLAEGLLDDSRALVALQRQEED
ncbi:gluconokinase [Deinococcus peraridilitoris]|uniref:Pentulose/hexulose kinase n=1 Tax=Deinococcus peraridilitoris (strain DSM 19664 / LMG 22246 / CIP 109416 / KR-200) TaxID=937777 RepID=L0A3I6_DEIPD|nr:gluconokinase [Deinococcus peraridilitoris]AFZ67999.1 pentulose/hexulose kinase [Deinococcus peraridilitoris DSM 19664]